MDLSQKYTGQVITDTQAGRFGIIYESYFSRIFNFLLKKSGNFSLARDLCADTFLKAFLSFQKREVKFQESLPWLYKIALNEYRLHLRSRKYKPKLVLKEIIPEQEDSFLEEEQQAEQEILSNENYRKLHSLLAQLKEVQKNCIMLKYVEGLSLEEISQITGLKVGTIKSHVSRGLKKMRDISNS